MRIELGIDEMSSEQVRGLAKQQRESIDRLSSILDHYDQLFVEIIEKNAIEKKHLREAAVTATQKD